MGTNHDIWNEDWVDAVDSNIPHINNHRYEITGICAPNNYDEVIDIDNE